MKPPVIRFGQVVRWAGLVWTITAEITTSETVFVRCVELGVPPRLIPPEEWASAALGRKSGAVDRAHPGGYMMPTPALDAWRHRGDVKVFDPCWLAAAERDGRTRVRRHGLHRCGGPGLGAGAGAVAGGRGLPPTAPIQDDSASGLG